MGGDDDVARQAVLSLAHAAEFGRDGQRDQCAVSVGDEPDPGGPCSQPAQAADHAKSGGLTSAAPAVVAGYHGADEVRAPRISGNRRYRDVLDASCAEGCGRRRAVRGRAVKNVE